jgi:hypothetical protein
MIGVHQVVERKALVQPIENVGTRRHFYRRRRPDGSTIDDIEWALGKGEEGATPVLRSFDELWPLKGADKGKIAELFAYQLIRGTRFKAEYEELTRRFIENYKKGGEAATGDPKMSRASDELLVSDDHRLIHMMELGPTLTSIVASMHWTLVEFRSPVLATSDHPVVLWPAGGSRVPEPTPLGVGALECLEYRLPLSPTRGVLMTWSDKPDDEEARVQGCRHHAANFNAFTVASADRQWFYRPGTSPPVGTGKLLPLSPELVSGYSLDAAARSRRREETSKHVQGKVGRELSDREVSIVSISRSGAP